VESVVGNAMRKELRALRYSRFATSQGDRQATYQRWREAQGLPIPLRQRRLPPSTRNRSCGMGRPLKPILDHVDGNGEITGQSASDTCVLIATHSCILGVEGTEAELRSERMGSRSSASTAACDRCVSCTEVVHARRSSRTHAWCQESEEMRSRSNVRQTRSTHWHNQERGLRSLCPAFRRTSRGSTSEQVSMADNATDAHFVRGLLESCGLT